MEKKRLWERCDECEKQKQDLYICLDCVETLCFQCNRKVHNKGTRVRHRRYETQKTFYSSKKDPRFWILYFSPECYRAIILHPKSSRFSRKVAEKAFEIVSKNTRQGFPMTLLDDLVPLLVKCFKQSSECIESTLNNIVLNENLFTYTKRKFGDSKVEDYLSLSLSSISVEALSWIILSIKNDKMQPSQNLIHSRIKEYFDIKINQKDWKKFIDRLNPKLVQNMNIYDYEIPEIEVKKGKDDLVLFFFKDEGEWEYEDFSPVNDEDEDYQIFLKYIDNFFSETNEEFKEEEDKKKSTKTHLGHFRNKYSRLSDSNKKYTQVKPKPKMTSHPEIINNNFCGNRQKIKNNLYSPCRGNHNYSANRDKMSQNSKGREKSFNSMGSKTKPRMWLSSVERPLDNSRSVNSQNEINAEKMLASKGHNRAIPGGKYGCALMTKRCGPESLKSKSLGRILALIKRALDQGVLNHWKTLLVKNNSKPNIDSSIREQNLYECSRNVIELLREHADGVSLAQFKQYYNRMFPNKSFDIDTLQFTKLTDFLKTMDEFVVIEKRDKNNNVAFLKKDVTFRSAYNHFNKLLKAVRPHKRKSKINPDEEYGHTMDVIRSRTLKNRTLMGDETNIYQPQSHNLNFGELDTPNKIPRSKKLYFWCIID